MDATLRKTGIRLYTGDYCPFCSRVRNELERLGLDYEVVDADADMREEVIRLSGQRAIPILTIGDEVLVDSSHIIRELRNRYAWASRGNSSPSHCSKTYSA
ncbi:MAG TPA: glutaredoxin family protein [Rubrobacter sp.]|jgi:glutaredoxin 3|nr:glutaredoxin family protein [Rubrobacter sp.]